MGRKLVRLAHLLGLSFGYPRQPQRAARPESGLLADVRNFHSVRTKTRSASGRIQPAAHYTGTLDNAH